MLKFCHTRDGLPHAPKGEPVKTRLMLLPLVLAVVACAHPPAAVTTPVRHTLSKLPNGIPGVNDCYRLRTQRVVFKVFRVLSVDRADWDAQARAVTNDCIGTRIWDDQWYYYTLDDSREVVQLLVWRNIDAHEYGYLAIRNTPSQWLVYTNAGGPWVVGNGQQIKRTWTSDQTRIDIDVKNPKNTGSWTANEIWASFGY
ncbi:MAG: hypothetical protein JWM80_5850 [Cyanobacteria bacterium RYN_339]|nr:hypothetical protein [Cyanobacteria bacterium RYN_339]